MQIFGTTCHAYVQKKTKLEPRSEQGVFIGYDGRSPAYLVYFPEKNDVKRVRCVKFNKQCGQESEILEDTPISKPLAELTQIQESEEEELQEDEEPQRDEEDKTAEDAADIQIGSVRSQKISKITCWTLTSQTFHPVLLTIATEFQIYLNHIKQLFHLQKQGNGTMPWMKKCKLCRKTTLMSRSLQSRKDHGLVEDGCMQ